MGFNREIIDWYLDEPEIPDVGLFARLAAEQWTLNCLLYRQPARVRSAKGVVSPRERARKLHA
jgi:hypothetical protein